ncbi:MAG: hypothetical protein AAF539_15865, partial [Planctomycetota bacterium]
MRFQPPAAERQDDATDTTKRRLILIPDSCVSTLPSPMLELLSDDFSAVVDVECASIEGDSKPAVDIYLRGSDRKTLLRRASESKFLDPSLAESCLYASGEQERRSREIRIDDFFALAYSYWQVQILTRRLRYTSNLDVSYFEKRVVDAAKAFFAENADACAEALHDAFDALAEERDHYFASDPSLIDLTLLTPQTVSDWTDVALADSEQADDPNLPHDDSILATPMNVLIDDAVAQSLSNDPALAERVKACLRQSDWAYAGGGPAPDVDIATLSCGEREHIVAGSLARVEAVTNEKPTVYARLGGGMNTAMVSAVASAGCVGVIPIDFLNGCGCGDESKVILNIGDHDVEALTAKPIDASDDASFLNLGPRLGEAIDGGEIATALMVHWPGAGCDSFHDIRRAATWTLALGKFWRIDDYFTSGEHPFHHGHAGSLLVPSANRLAEDHAEKCSAIMRDRQRQRDANLQAMSCLLSSSASQRESDTSIEFDIASGLGFEPADSNEARLLVRPTSPAARAMINVDGKVNSRFPAVFASEFREGATDLIVDVPAFGFGWVSSNVTAPEVLLDTTEQPTDRDGSQS